MVVVIDVVSSSVVYLVHYSVVLYFVAPMTFCCLFMESMLW